MPTSDVGFFIFGLRTRSSFQCVTLASNQLTRSISSDTGPTRPEGSNGESVVYLRMLVGVYVRAAGGCASPMIRFGQRLVTTISSVLRPGKRSAVMSSR